MLWKFLHKRDVPFVLDEGTVRLGNSKHYRDMEDLHGRGIGDRLESSREVNIRERLVLTEGSPELEMVNRNLASPMYNNFAIAESGGRIVMMGGGAVRFEQAPVYIYSMAEGADPGVLRDATDVPGQPPYDATLRITDLDGLLLAIGKGEVLELGNSTLTADIVTRFCVGPVAYKKLVRDITDEGHPDQEGPFVKDAFFSGQCEHRIAFYPRDARSLPPRLTIKISEPERFFELV